MECGRIQIEKRQAGGSAGLVRFPIGTPSGHECQLVDETSKPRRLDAIDRRFPAGPNTLIVQGEQMPVPLETEFDLAAGRDMNTFRKPPVPADAETLDGPGSGYPDGGMNDDTAGPRVHLR